MILTITLNPCIDKSTRVPELKPEAKLRCTDVVNEPGGGGINVSKGLLRLGAETLALMPAGGHNGSMLCSLMEAEKIPFHAVDTKVETRENWIVLEENNNHQFRFTFPGREVEEKAISELIGLIDKFSPAFVVASGSLPPGLPASFYGAIVQASRAAGAQCIIDTSGPALQALKNQHAFLIKPNIGELCKMLNIEQLEKQEVPEAAQRAIREGCSQMMAVSMGPDGAWLVTEHEKYYCKAPAVEKKSTVGAGDSMVAGMTYMLSSKKPLEEVIRFGVACGTAATMNAGTQLFKPDDVQELFSLLNPTSK